MLGIVVMITGCNSLISQQFGTHRLRTVSLPAVIEEGLGDADHVRVTGGELASTYIVGEALRESDEDYHLHPILTPEQQQAHAAGDLVEVSLVGWYKLPYSDCLRNGDCLPADPQAIGLVGEPTEKKNPVAEWERHNLRLAPDVYYLQLWKEPMAWYWNLLLFLGGLGLALGVEAIYHQRKNTATGAQTHGND